MTRFAFTFCGLGLLYGCTFGYCCNSDGGRDLNSDMKNCGEEVLVTYFGPDHQICGSSDGYRLPAECKCQKLPGTGGDFVYVNTPCDSTVKISTPSNFDECMTNLGWRRGKSRGI